MEYYAELTTPEGKVIDLSDKIDELGYFLSTDRRLKGDLESNAERIYCDNTQLTSLNAPNAEKIYCDNTQLTSLNAPNAEKIHCDDTQLASLNAPNAERIDCDNTLLKSLNAPKAIRIYCKNSNLKALVKECGKSKRQIWSQKVDDVIYTYIGCGRFTLEDAIAAISIEYTGKAAADYIEKVKLSQSKADD